ncbi:hypothetical protein HRbin02_00831 [Candidatus Calditenuaceae archaeon HR02]|nr:hypothetical protein HRbin02_00831 [Candidatus Calditenuaceae archaeon HR02]
MSPSKLLGYLMVTLSPIGFTFYTLWFFGLLQGLDSDLVLRATVYLLAVSFFFVVGVLGYLVVTAPRPRVATNGDGGGSRRA